VIMKFKVTIEQDTQVSISICESNRITIQYISPILMKRSKMKDVTFGDVELELPKYRPSVKGVKVILKC